MADDEGSQRTLTGTGQRGSMAILPLLETPVTEFCRVHSLAEARTAILAAADEAVWLESPAAAAGFQGIGWWQALLSALAEEFPDQRISGVLDCGSAPGHALAALRAGVTCVRVQGAPPEVLASLEQIAASLGATIII